MKINTEILVVLQKEMKTVFLASYVKQIRKQYSNLRVELQVIKIVQTDTKKVTKKKTTRRSLNDAIYLSN